VPGATRSAPDEPNDEGEYNLALVYPIRRWFAVLEGNGETNRERTNYYLTPEVVWQATQALEFRLAIRPARSRHPDDRPTPMIATSRCPCRSIA